MSEYRERWRFTKRYLDQVSKAAAEKAASLIKGGAPLYPAPIGGSMIKTATHNVPKPEGIIKLDSKKDVAVSVKTIRNFIKVKKTGELKGIAFYLPKAYKWVMANDTKGNLCLLPRKLSV